MGKGFTESEVEEAALEWLGGLGYSVLFGPEIAPGEARSEREHYEEAFIPGRLRDALERLNPDIPPEALDEAYRKVTRIDSPNHVDANANFHDWLANGIPVEYS